MRHVSTRWDRRPKPHISWTRSRRACARGNRLDTLFTNVIAAQGLAGYYAWLGDVDGTLEWVIVAYELSPSGVDLRTIESGLFDKVRSDSRLAERLAELRAGIWPRVGRERVRARERGLVR